MNQEQFKPVKKKKTPILFIFVVIIIIAGAAVVLGFQLGIFGEPEPYVPVLASSFSSITAEEAYDLINTSSQYIIIDSRPCPCKYNTEHIGLNGSFEATLPPDNDSELYNLTIDLIIYDAYGNLDATNYCERFINHIYGKICYIEGGFSSWKNNSFPTIRPESSDN